MMALIRTNLGIALVALAVLATCTTKVLAKKAIPVAYEGYDGYGGEGEGGYGGYGGYGAYGGHGGHGKWNDVEMFLDMRDKLIQVATNAVGFSQYAAINSFNSEAFYFPYSFPGKLSLYVRELEKVPPYYKYDYLYKKSRNGAVDLN